MINASLRDATAFRARQPSDSAMPFVMFVSFSCVAPAEYYVVALEQVVEINTAQ